MGKDFKRTPETIELNKKLEIVKIDHDYKFRKSERVGISTSGHCFYIEGKGYVAFEEDSVPYTPSGGINSLQSILNEGGFLYYDCLKFITPIHNLGVQRAPKQIWT